MKKLMILLGLAVMLAGCENNAKNGELYNTEAYLQTELDYGKDDFQGFEMVYDSSRKTLNVTIDYSEYVSEVVLRDPSILTPQVAAFKTIISNLNNVASEEIGESDITIDLIARGIYHDEKYDLFCYKNLNLDYQMGVNNVRSSLNDDGIRNEKLSFNTLDINQLYKLVDSFTLNGVRFDTEATYDWVNNVLEVDFNSSNLFGYDENQEEEMSATRVTEFVNLHNELIQEANNRGHELNTIFYIAGDLLFDNGKSPELIYAMVNGVIE